MTAAARRTDKEARRAELVAAAAAAFAEHGVANTAVSDIVKTAGVAQGTFYLYFSSKDEITLAVVEQMAEGMVAAIEGAVDTSGASAVEKLLGLRDVLTSFEADDAAVELADFIHRPENRALHDRLAELFTPALVPLMEGIVAQGVSEGVFDVEDVASAAWFVLGGLQSAELAATPAGDMPAAIRTATDMALRALGYTPSVADACD